MKSRANNCTGQKEKRDVQRHAKRHKHYSHCRCITSSLHLVDVEMPTQSFRGMTPEESSFAQDLFLRLPCWEAWEGSSWLERLQLPQQLTLQLTRWQLQLLLKPGLPRRGPWAHRAPLKSKHTGCKFASPKLLEGMKK